MELVLRYYLKGLIWLASFTALGGIAEYVVQKYFRKIAQKTHWEGDDLIIGAFKKIIFFWGIIAGVYFGNRFIPVEDSIKQIIDKLDFSALVISASIVVIRIITGFIRQRTETVPGLSPSASIIDNSIRVVVFIIGGLIILQMLGISITPILTALGVGGLAVALALQDTLSNLFSGIQMIASQQIKTGDYIKLSSGEEGFVIDITWRSTTIRTLPNNVVIVPNAKLAASILTNFQLSDKEIAVPVTIGVSYNSDLEFVEKIAIKAAKTILQNTPGAVKDFEPTVRFHTFADSSINFNISLRANEYVDQFLLKHEFIKEIHRQFAANNIEIPFPIRTVIMQNNNKSTP